MEIAEASRLIKALADGVDPLTGEVFPADSPYQQADTVRALYLALEALDHLDKMVSKDKRLPDHAGKPWSQQEDEALGMAFDGGATIQKLAETHKRTIGSINSRLLKLGKLQP